MRVNSYKDLNLFFSDRLFLESISEELKLATKEKELEDCLIVLMGLYLLNLNFTEGFFKFTSNRYFLDCIKIEKYPNEKTFFSFKTVVNEIFKKNGLEVDSWFSQISDEVFNMRAGDCYPSILSGMGPEGISSSEKDFFDDNGYLVVENCLDPVLCDELMLVLKNLAGGEKLNSTAFLYGSNDAQRIWHLINKNQIFQEIILHRVIKSLNDHAFDRDTLHDKYYLSSFHANILNPGAEKQIIHVDANVPSPLPSWIIRTNVNFIIQDYTQENGATLVYPGSHKFLEKPDRTKNYDEYLVPLEAKKGSLVFWTGHVWHQSGKNASSHDRYSILGCFAASYLREMAMEENPYISSNIFTNQNFNSELKTLLGWDHGQKQ